MTDPQESGSQANESSPHVAAFCRSVERFMDHGTPIESVHLAACTLAAEALRRELRPEEILAAVKQVLVLPVPASEQHRVAQSRRYSQAIHTLITVYFGQRERGRTVADQSGVRWHVYLVEEGGRWDPEIEMRRHNWLCCQSESGRRFIAPVPPDWHEWSDAALAAAIAPAPHDHRGGSLDR